MEYIRAYRFRIYPDVKRQEEIDGRLILAQQFYNQLLEKSILSYKNGNKKISMVQLNKFARETIASDKKYLKLYSQTRCEIEYRLLKAYQNFFRRVKEKSSGKRQKAGFPRIRSRDRYKSLTYPQDNGAFSMEKDRLRISRIGTMKIELHRDIRGKVKTMTIKREAGKYYAIFTAVKEAEPAKMRDTNPAGIDLGLNSFITISDGTKIGKPKFMQERKRKLARWQKTIARREKGSKRRGKAKVKLQTEWETVNNQSNDFAHKLSDRLVNSGYTSFALENLNIQNMVKNHNLAQSIHNASWNRFIQFLSYKAESAGLRIEKVDARNTSKACSNCGNIQEMPLSERIYNCKNCGMSKDRDINASINILNRATLGQRESNNAQGDSGQYISTGNASHIEELRTYSANHGGSLGL